MPSEEGVIFLGTEGVHIYIRNKTPNFKVKRIKSHLVKEICKEKYNFHANKLSLSLDKGWNKRNTERETSPLINFHFFCLNLKLCLLHYVGPLKNL